MDGAAAVITVISIITSLATIGTVIFGGAKIIFMVGEKLGSVNGEIKRCSDNIEVLFEKHDEFSKSTTDKLTGIKAEQSATTTAVSGLKDRVGRIETCMNGNLRGGQDG